MRVLFGARGQDMPSRALAGCLCVLALCGCAGDSRRSAARQQRGERSAIERYVRQVEPVRLAVNALLARADPILHELDEQRIGHAMAAWRIGALKRRFATFAVDVAAIQAPNEQLRILNVGYADTYVLEDTYLSALTTGLADGEPDDLPETQAQQRTAIIRWRIGLTVLARRADASLPANLQQAGRGEIAPSLNGS